MSRQPSEKTQLANLKRDYHKQMIELRTARIERDNQSIRAQRFEAELQEWKRRFDNLLSKIEVAKVSVKEVKGE